MASHRSLFGMMLNDARHALFPGPELRRFAQAQPERAHFILQRQRHLRRRLAAALSIALALTLFQAFAGGELWAACVFVALAMIFLAINAQPSAQEVFAMVSFKAARLGFHEDYNELERLDQAMNERAALDRACKAPSGADSLKSPSRRL